MEHGRQQQRRSSHRAHRDGREQIEALARFPLFAGCTRAELRRIDALTYELDVPPGRVLVREGAPASQVLFVTAGQVRATRGTATIGSYEPGSCIGAAECAQRAVNPDTVVAETTVTVLASSAHEFRSLVDIPAIARLAETPVVSTPAVYEPAAAETLATPVPAYAGGVPVS
jgi:CRP-like cAMP-binding protein